MSQNEYINDEVETDDYDRERTLAVMTGLICLCVSLGGTVLGSYHAIITIGVLAGLLATACYVIADLVVAWAARIDYKESDNAMEWCSWTVKYILSFVLLFIGGCIAYTLFSDGGVENNRNATSGRAKSAFQDCLKNGGKQHICQRQYDSVMKNESGVNVDMANSAKVEWLEKMLHFPLFNYIPGVLGLFGAVALTLVAKLTANKKKKNKVEQPLYTTGKANVKLSNPVAPLKAPSKRYASVSNGKESFRLRTVKGNSGSVQISWRGGGQELFCKTVSDADAEKIQYMDYFVLGSEMVVYMKSKGMNYKPIEVTL